MGKVMANYVLTKFRHPLYKSPVLGPRVFVDVKDKDLPYDGDFKSAPRSIFDHPLGLRKEGALLMAILAGVQGGPLQKLTKGSPGWELLYGTVDEEAMAADNLPGVENEKKKMEKKHTKVDTIKKILSGLSTGKKKNNNAKLNSEPFPTLQQALTTLVDVAIDTKDLEELTADDSEQETVPVNWLFETSEEEDVYRTSLKLDEKVGPANFKAIPLHEYIKLVKKAMGRIGNQTQLLEDLALGEDIDMWVKESDLPPPLPVEQEKPKEIKSGDPGAKPPPDYKGAMRATSLVVKKARRLAGLMHIEQQTNDLKDVYDWLQHLGNVAIATDRTGKGDDTMMSTPRDQSSGHDTTDLVTTSIVDGQHGDWRLPTSPAVALLMAQEDLRQRLAHLYQEQNLMETRKDQLDAAKKLVGKNLGGDGEEEGYEVLGGKIAENLDDADNLDQHYRQLTAKAKEEDDTKSQKAKKGKKGKGGKKGGKKKKDDSEAGLSEDASSEGGVIQGKKPRKGGKKKQKDESSEGDETKSFTLLSPSESESDNIESGGRKSKSDQKTKLLKGETISEGHDLEVKEGTELSEHDGTTVGEDDIDSRGKKDRKRKKMEDSESEVQSHDKDAGSEGKKSGNVLIRSAKDAKDTSPGISSESMLVVKSGEKSTSTEPTKLVAKTSLDKNSTSIDQHVQVGSSMEFGDHPRNFAGTNVVGSGAPPTYGPITSVSVETGGPRELTGEVLEINKQDARTQTSGARTLVEDSDVTLEEFEIVHDVVCKPNIPHLDQAIQTDDAVLFSLMESMMEEMPGDDHHVGPEDEATELKRLRRDLKKARMQLRFWRSRNWVEKHSRLSPSGSGAHPHPIIDAPSEAGFSFYFNTLRASSMLSHASATSGGGGGGGGGGHVTTPLRTREIQAQVEPPSHSTPPMNAKLMSTAPSPTLGRPTRPSRRVSPELQSLAAGGGLVIFGRSSNLITPSIDPQAIAHLPTQENRISRVSPRLSGVHYQKA